MQKAVHVDQRHDHQPKPQNQVGFLVEQIDWQGALHCEHLNIRELANINITQCNSGKQFGVVVLLSDYISKRINTIKYVSIANELS